MTKQAEAGEVAPFGAGDAVVAIGVNGEAASGEKFTPHFDVPGTEQLDQIGHDDIDAVFVEVAVVPEAEEVEFQRFTFYHVLVRDIGNINGSEIRLAGFRAQAGKFGAIEFDEIIPVCMFIGNPFQQSRIVIVGILGILAAQLLQLVQAFAGVVWHIYTPFSHYSV